MVNLKQPLAKQTTRSSSAVAAIAYLGWKDGWMKSRYMIAC